MNSCNRYDPFSYGINSEYIKNVELNRIDLNECKTKTEKFMKEKEEKSLWNKFSNELNTKCSTGLKKVEYWETTSFRKKLMNEIVQIHDLKKPIHTNKSFDYVSVLKLRNKLLKELEVKHKEIMDKKNLDGDQGSYCVIC
jgi:hypothetical protein